MRNITMDDMNKAVLSGKVHGSCQLSADCDFWYSWGEHEHDYVATCPTIALTQSLDRVPKWSGYAYDGDGELAYCSGYIFASAEEALADLNARGYCDPSAIVARPVITECRHCGWTGSESKLIPSTVYRDYGDVGVYRCPKCGHICG